MLHGLRRYNVSNLDLSPLRGSSAICSLHQGVSKGSVTGQPITEIPTTCCGKVMAASAAKAADIEMALCSLVSRSTLSLHSFLKWLLFPVFSQQL